MSPRKKKPAAEPIVMPRTEKDTDDLLGAIEKHLAVGNRIGELVNSGDYDAKTALDMAGRRDQDLYNVMNRVQEERHLEREKEIEAENAGD